MTLWIMKTLHHWFGVAFAAFFFVIALSGAWVVVGQNILPPLLSTTYKQKPMSLSETEAAEKVSAIIDVFGQPQRIEFPVEGHAVFVVKFQDNTRLVLDQKTLGRIEPFGAGPVTAFMRRLHVNLHNPFGIGHEIVIWSGLIGAFLGGLGILIFLPQWRSFRKKEIPVPRKVRFQDMRRSHLSTGIIFAAFVIAFGLSGWAIGEPGDASAIFGLPHSGGAENVISVLNGNALSVFDVLSGSFGDSAEWHVASRETDVLATVEALHSGRSKSAVYGILITLLGVIVALLSATGLLSYLLRWQKKLSVTAAKLRKSR